MKKRLWIQNEKDGSKIYFNKKNIAREISKMPYYQVKYNQKQIINMLEYDEIPKQHIIKAIEFLKK